MLASLWDKLVSKLPGVELCGRCRARIARLNRWRRGETATDSDAAVATDSDGALAPEDSGNDDPGAKQGKPANVEQRLASIESKLDLILRRLASSEQSATRKANGASEK